MEVIFLGLGGFCFIGVALVVAIAALAISRRNALALAKQTVSQQQAPPQPLTGGTIAISDILGHLVPATGG